MVMNLQYFGGRGSSSGIGNGNIIAFGKKADTERSSGWDYRGEAERVDKLIKNANEAKSVSQISRAALSLMKEDEHISTLMREAETDGGDVNALLTLRRKIRQQRKKTRF